MRTLVALCFAVAAGSVQALNARYECELKSRHNVMESFEVASKTFDGDKPIEVRLQNFRMRFQTTLIEGKETLALLVGQGKTFSSVTLAPLGQKEVYLNFKSDEEFAVATCRIVE